MTETKNRIDYNIEVIKEDEKKEIFEFLLEYFVKDEPIHKTLGLVDCPEIEDFFMKGISQNCNFKAVTKDGEVIGICLSAIGKPLTPNEKETESNKPCSEKWKVIGKLIGRIDQDYNILDHYPIFIDGKAIATNPKYRGMGIAGELLKANYDFMQKNNIPVMKRICSSAFSARVMEKLGMTEVHRLRFADFKDANGKQIVKPEMPHEFVRTFIIEVPLNK